MKHRLVLVSIAMGALLFSADAGLSQTDARNVPKPPTAELEKFRPYFGLYELSGDFAGLEWSGILEITPAVKGWYVEWVIDIHHAQAIDRQLRMFITWDPTLEKYRIWRFETGNPQSPEATEGEARFDSNQLVMEWHWKAPDGDPGIYRNRVSMNGPELVIVTEFEKTSGSIQEIGVTRARRRL